MVILITGGTHTGKTLFAQRLLEKYAYPYLSIDHLKMGLIRSGNTNFTPTSSEGELTAYLWPIVREMIKTAIENRQNLIVEGCYIPFTYRDDFTPEYLEDIKFVCLILEASHIERNYQTIIEHASVIEHRMDDHVPREVLVSENERNLFLCLQYGLDYILVDNDFNPDEAKMP